MNCDYSLEDLVPIVAELTDHYTSMESTSITYEKARELMGAVIYHINESERDERENIVLSTKISAREKYENGYKAVLNKVRYVNAMYSRLVDNLLEYNYYWQD